MTNYTNSSTPYPYYPDTAGYSNYYGHPEFPDYFNYSAYPGLASLPPYSYYLPYPAYPPFLVGAAPPANIFLVESVTLKTENVTANKTTNTSGPLESFILINQTVIQFCGFPAFCSNKAHSACANTPLCACAECSKTGAGFFVFFVVLLGLACVFGNVLVMAVLKKLGLRQSFNKMKFSLAVADFLTGVQLLVVSIYNFSWTMNVSSNELLSRQIELTGTPEATAGGIFLLLTLISSLYHLVFMGAQRFYAIKCPLSYRTQSDFHVNVGLAVVWALALVSSTMPAWFPGSIIYTYQHTIFLFYVSNINKPTQTGSYTGLVVLMVVFFVIPYLAMLFTTMATMVTVRRNIKKSKQLSLRSSDKKSKQEQDRSKREIKIFVVVGLMQLGFTITIIPVILVNILFYANFLNCNNVSLPFLICFYLGMTNSLVNVIIYSFRDKTFNKATKKLFAVSSCCKQQKKTFSTVFHTGGKTVSTVA